MNRKENEAVVNRFLLSSLYYILGLFAIYGIYKFAQSLAGYKMIYEYNIFLWLTCVSVAGLIASVITKNKYYGIVSSATALCFVLLHVYWPVIANLYTKTAGHIPNVLTYSYVPYVGCAVLITVLYVYECVYYALNVKNKNN